MNVMEAIMTRRSIRKFTDAPVAAEDVKDMLEAAMMAPSAGNGQPWHFVVVDDHGMLAACKDINPYAAMAPKAPLGILVCAEPSLSKFPAYWEQDCSAAIQNILLAAHGKGLGAVWTGIHPEKDRTEGFSKLFGLPEGIIPLGLVVIGHPDQTLKSESRYKEERVHTNGW